MKFLLKSSKIFKLAFLFGRRTFGWHWIRFKSKQRWAWDFYEFWNCKWQSTFKSLLVSRTNELNYHIYFWGWQIQKNSKMTASPLAAAKRLQFNMDFKPIESIGLVKTMPTLVFPIFWIEESVVLPKVLVNQLKHTIFLWVLISKMEYERKICSHSSLFFFPFNFSFWIQHAENLWVFKMVLYDFRRCWQVNN